MPLYVGDYMTDTSMLTIEQSGAYLHLLMYSWRTGRLPDDDGELAILCRVTPTYWKRHIAPKVRPFFLVQNGFLVSARLEKEREKATKNIQQRTQASHSRQFKKSNDVSKDIKDLALSDDVSADDRPEPTRSVPSPSPLPIESKKEERSLRSCSAKGRTSVLAGQNFDDFWSVYPRRQDRGHAEKAFAKACTLSDPQTIIAAARGYKFSANPKYIPLAATWLNGKRWTDEVDNRDPVLVAAGVYDEPEEQRHDNPVLLFARAAR
jgi:uncharacterized protein YdaU (DUF1376 family)